MANVLHRNATGADAIHPAAYVQSADPGGVGANKFWVDTTTGPPYALKLRNSANTAWILFAAGSTGATGAAGASGPIGAIGSTAVVGAAPYVCMQDQRASGANSGTFTSGAFQTRTLNTIIANDQNLAVLDTATNRITLPAGTWRCNILAPGQAVDRHQARLQNITDGATMLTGTSMVATVNANVQTDSAIIGRFALRSPKVLEIQHRCQTTRSTDGFGIPGSFGLEIYTVAEFWLEAGPPPFLGNTFENPNMSALVRRFIVVGQDHQQHSLNTPPQ